ncbi:GerMN domain-containing protein [Paeniglutamicibacter quisquiliarum]|uniref:GerMN domain-containing protein n=1 Tax=Paeniglutamicibacter quisquiliarum TaxID=2849498 RepID=UPI0020C435DA|nr:GerMN domain-containing protein [Paeniglutamicibacter quisquiliarum]
MTVFYVALGDQGQAGPMIGCGDSIVATETGPVIYASQVEAAMSDLLENKDTVHGESGLMNALAGSNLRYVSSSVSGNTVTVELTGDLSSGGICDDPRIIAQLTYTAMVAAGAGEARILIDGIDIGDKLSQK